MTSLDERGEQDAHNFTTSLVQRDEKLRMYLGEIVDQMIARATKRGVKLQEMGKWLYTKTWAKTYAATGQAFNRGRDERRIRWILELCGYDAQLMLSAYSSVLNHKITPHKASHTWNPQLVMLDSGHRTIIHRYKRLRR